MLQGGWLLYAITGGSGKMRFSTLLFLINFQCFVSICLSLWALSLKCVTKTNFFSLSLGLYLKRIWCLWLNLTMFRRGKTCLCLHPLCNSLFVNLCFMFWNSFSFEFVLRYRLASPLLMALIVVGG